MAQTLGARLHDLRVAAGHTQVSLGAAMGYSNNHVSNSMSNSASEIEGGGMSHALRGALQHAPFGLAFLGLRAKAENARCMDDVARLQALGEDGGLLQPAAGGEASPEQDGAKSALRPGRSSSIATQRLSRSAPGSAVSTSASAWTRIQGSAMSFATVSASSRLPRAASVLAIFARSKCWAICPVSAGRTVGSISTASTTISGASLSLSVCSRVDTMPRAFSDSPCSCNCHAVRSRDSDSPGGRYARGRCKGGSGTPGRAADLSGNQFTEPHANGVATPFLKAVSVIGFAEPPWGVTRCGKMGTVF